MPHVDWNVVCYRLAPYYLARLRDLSEAYLQGGNTISETLATFKADWEQIRQMQSWAAKEAAVDEAAALLCSSFATVGSVLIYIRHSPQEQIRWFQPAVDAARQLGNRESVSDHLCHLGNAYTLASEYPKALAYYEEAITLAQEINNLQLQAAAHSGMARCYRRLGQAEKAAQNEKLSLSIMRINGSPRNIGRALGNWAAGICAEGRYRESIELLQEALAISRQEGDVSGEAQHLINLGVAYLGFEQKRTAILYFEQALRAARVLEQKELESNILGNLAIAYHLLGDYQPAVKYYLLAADAAIELGDRQLAATHWFNLGAVYMQIADYPLAMKAFERAKIIFTELNLIQNAVEAQKQIDTIKSESRLFLWSLRRFTQLIHAVRLNRVVLKFKDWQDRAERKRAE